jgi:hypothetical protein
MTDPSVQPVAAPSAFARARAALTALRDRLSTWWAETNRKWPVAWIVCVAVLLIGTVLLSTCSDSPDLAQRPAEADQTAAVQADPLSPLVDRIKTLEAQVAALQSTPPVPPAARQSAQRTAPRAVQPAEAAAAYSEAQPSPAWGTTDLDRDLANFVPPTAFGASK